MNAVKTVNCEDACKSVQILIRWLRQKPADLDLYWSTLVSKEDILGASWPLKHFLGCSEES